MGGALLLRQYLTLTGGMRLPSASPACMLCLMIGWSLERGESTGFSGNAVLLLLASLRQKIALACAEMHAD